MNLCYLNGFTKVFSKEITLNKPIEDDNLRLVYGDFKKLYIIDANDIPIQYRDNHYINLSRINVSNKTEYFDENVRFYSYYSDHIVYPYLNYKSIDEMQSESIKMIVKNNYFINNNIYTRSSLIVKIDKRLEKYYIVYYINNKIIENIKQNKRELKATLLTNILIKQKELDLLKIGNSSLMTVLNTKAKVYNLYNDNQDNLLKSNINLYNYQKQDIEWIKDIERRVLEGNNIIKYQYSPIYGVLDNQFLLHNYSLLPIYFDINNNQILDRSFEFYGGHIISEVGLGKTLTMIHHILSDNRNMDDFYSKYVEFADNCNYFYKRGKLKGQVCPKNKINELYCKEHKNTPFIDKRCINFVNLDSFDITNYIYKDLIKTNASIIICPNHLCDQWVHEYYSKFQNKHRIIFIVTSDQYINLKFGDLLFADLVIVSYNFLLNVKYDEINVYNSDQFNLVQFIKSKIDVDISQVLTDDQKSKLLNSPLHILNLFHWNRVVLDEVHEIQNLPKNSVLKTRIKNLKSIYKWNITATPFAHKLQGFINIMNFVSDYGNGYTNNHLNTDDLIKLGIECDIVERCQFLFRRNTKTSIKDEYSGNIIEEYVNFLDFTSQERSIYDSYSQSLTRTNYYDFLVKLCCHPELNADTKEMIRNCKTFDEIQVCLLKYNEDLMEKEHLKMINSKTDIEYYEKELEKFQEPYTELELENVNLLRIKIGNSRRQYTIVKKNYEDISRTYNYLKSSIDNLKSEDLELTCPICLDDIDKDGIVITKCGHKFCWDCIYETHKVQMNNNANSQIKCPTCNSFMLNTELYILKNDIHNNSVSELEHLVQSTRSTKIGNIIHFLKTSLKENDKVILFSQWDEILKKVGQILTDHKLKIVYCQGTVYQKKRAISNFSNDKDVNIILLSSRNAASGINLTVANKIILLEPIYGTKEYRYNIESQAVGRADRLGQKRPIDIVRFIVKNTVEEDIYNNCIDENRLINLSLN